MVRVDLTVLDNRDILTSMETAITSGHGGYSVEPPYSPGVLYPEYPFGSDTLSKEINPTYEGVRDCLRLLSLDAEHHGQTCWNPLGNIVHPGGTVVLKPNFVRHFRETRAGHGNCLITHGSVIRAALDYVYIALQGEGRIIIADAPQDDADFDAIREMAGLNAIQEFCQRHGRLQVEVYDLRPEKTETVSGITVGYDQLPGDPRGYVKVDLDRHSMFAEIEHVCHLVYGSDYDADETRRHHTGGVHEYLISRTILEADCVIDLPKLKTHKKTGLTVCMKNLVGINGNKNWLPHHRLGTPAQNGDQFADDGPKHRVERRMMECFRRLFPLLGPLRGPIAKPLKMLGTTIFGDTNTDMVRSGNWYGNDTAWRMVIDLNRALMYADQHGVLQDAPTRSLICLVDGIVGGEGNGPLDPMPKATGVVVGGINPVAVELVCARIMGFDYARLPLLHRALDGNHALPLVGFGYDQIVCRSNVEPFDVPLHRWDGLSLAFRPHFGWRGHIETDCFEAVTT